METIHVLQDSNDVPFVVQFWGVLRFPHGIRDRGGLGKLLCPSLAIVFLIGFDYRCLFRSCLMICGVHGQSLCVATLCGHITYSTLHFSTLQYRTILYCTIRYITCVVSLQFDGIGIRASGSVFVTTSTPILGWAMEILQNQQDEQQ